jgi:hypothetical protein
MLLDVDGTSSVEVGTAGGAAVGSITIDNGVTATVFGSSFQAPSIVDNGTIIVAAGGGVSLHGSLSGNGQIEIASDAELDVYGPAALNAPSISFEGSGDALTLTRSAFNGSQQFTSTLIGFDADDVINCTGTVTSAVYASTGTNIGTLSLYNNTTLVGTLTLAGDYSGDAFSAVSTSSGTQIVDPPAPMVDVPNAATSEISSASVDAVTFTGNTGTLQLDQSQSFAGTVAGFGAENQIDLADISFWANTTLGYSPNAANNAGILSVSDGTHVANIALLGQYMASSFVMASDGHGGTLINDPPANQQPLLTHPHA